MSYNYFIGLLVAVTLQVHVFAGNTAPVVHNLRTSVAPGSTTIVVQYDLEDRDNTAVKVTFQLLAADGRYVTLDDTRLSGDVGYPVQTGGSREIRYDFANLLSDVRGYRVRLIIDDLQKPDITKVVDAINIDNIKNDILFLSRKRHYKEDSAALQVIKQKIENDFRDNHLLVNKQEFTYGSYKATNISGMLKGLDTSGSKIFIVGAHWDAVKGSPGSDDNASGVAGMLEVMRVLSKYSCNNSVYFVGFDLEEEGLVGSRQFVKRLPGANANHTGLAINLDMIAYHSSQAKSQIFPGAMKGIFPDAYKTVSGDDFKGDFILNTMNEASQVNGKKFDSCAALYVPGLEVVSLVVPDDGRFAPGAFRSSDHVSFWDAGMKAISIGDTGDMRNENYHAPSDIIESIDFNFLHNVTKATVATIAAMAGITNAVAFESEITAP